MRTAWVCDSCDSNNIKEDTVCWLCRRPQGSASGEIPAVSAGVPTDPQQTRPVFLESKHTPELLAVTLIPPPPPRPAVSSPPARPVVPPRPAVSGRTVRRVALWFVLGVAALLAVGNLDKLSGLLPDFSVGTTAPTTTQTAATCPEAVAKWLPGAGGGAVLVAQYDTDRHVVTVCQSADGRYYYDGQVRGEAASSKTHINLPATKTSTGFAARNKTYLYEISGSELILTNNGKPVSRWTLVPSH